LAVFAEIVLQDTTLLALLFYGILSFNFCLYPDRERWKRTVETATLQDGACSWWWWWWWWCIRWTACWPVFVDPWATV